MYPPQSEQRSKELFYGFIAGEKRRKAPAHIRITQELTTKCLLCSDFFKTQPVRAGVYYLRPILHNWSDKYAIRILQALVPALEPGARVLVHELVLPEPNTSSMAEERRMR